MVVSLQHPLQQRQQRPARRPYTTDAAGLGVWVVAQRVCRNSSGSVFKQCALMCMHVYTFSRRLQYSKTEDDKDSCETVSAAAMLAAE